MPQMKTLSVKVSVVQSHAASVSRSKLSALNLYTVWSLKKCWAFSVCRGGNVQLDSEERDLIKKQESREPSGRHCSVPGMEH